MKKVQILAALVAGSCFLSSGYLRGQQESQGQSVVHARHLTAKGIRDALSSQDNSDKAIALQAQAFHDAVDDENLTREAVTTILNNYNTQRQNAKNDNERLQAIEEAKLKVSLLDTMQHSKIIGQNERILSSLKNAASSTSIPTAKSESGAGTWTTVHPNGHPSHTRR